MDFLVIPQTHKLGPIPAKNLRDAIGMKHCLLAKMDIRSSIQDADGFVVSEKEQSTFIFDFLC
jgi:hypothetical protein